MISRVYRTLDWFCSMCGIKVTAQKPQFTQISENCRKCIASPTDGISASDSLPLEHARELFEPSKDSWSLCSLHWKKKTFEIYVRGFRWVLLEKGKVLLFLIVLLWRLHPVNGPNMWLKIWLYSSLKYESLEPLMDFLAFLGPKLWPDNPKSLGMWLSDFKASP